MRSHTRPASPTSSHTTPGADPTAPQTPEQPDHGPSADPTQPIGSTAHLAGQGLVHFYAIRTNGTARHLPYLPLGSEPREVADWLAYEEENGTSVADLATASGLSRATVRRLIAAAELAEDVEAGDYDELVGDDGDAVMVGDPDTTEATVGRGIGPVTDVANFAPRPVGEDA